MSMVVNWIVAMQSTDPVWQSIVLLAGLDTSESVVSAMADILAFHSHNPIKIATKIYPGQ